MSRPRGTAAAAGALILLLAACSAPAPDPATTRDPVRAVVMPYLNMMPFHIAQQEGYFAEQRLDVEFVHVARTQDIMASLASGGVDAAGGMLTINELNLIASGARVRMVADLGRLSPDHCTFNAIVVRREHLESGALTDPARIRQLRFDTDILIGFGYWLDVLLQPYGLTIDDIDIVNLPSPAALEAIATGSIDVTMDSEPNVSRLLATGATAIWRGNESLAPDYHVSVVMYGPSLLDARPEVGERFAVAMLKAIRQYGAGKTPRTVDIVQQATGLERELVEAACWPTLRDSGVVEPASFDGFQQWALRRGLVDRLLRPDELFEPRFMAHAAGVLDR